MNKIILFIIIFFVLFFYLSFKFKKIEKFKEKEKLDEQNSFIFVSVASFRDLQCSNTIDSIFNNASNPERIVVGVCEQNSNVEENCIKKPVINGKIKMISINANKARGPCLARYYVSTLFNNEDVFLQIDSHTKFTKNWDNKIIKMLNNMPYDIDKAVISHYPFDCNKIEWEQDNIPVINNATKIENSVYGFTADTHSQKGKYSTSRQIGGGFLLMHKSILKKCPIDPNLQGLFNNEELLYTARLFTHGINVISPSYNICCHMYNNEQHKTPWDEQDFDWTKNTNGKQRAIQLLEGKINDEYGFGNVRTLQDFWKHININIQNNEIQKFNVIEL